MEKIRLKTSSRIELLDITEKIQKLITNSGVSDGVCIVFCPHTTAGLTINENADPSVKNDITAKLNKLVPENSGYTHAEGNSDSHIKASLFGASLTIFVGLGKLILGTWQAIYFCEGDGPRQREVWVKVIKEA
jgi:secondary thiamine-phosphate synthase enzyme